MLARHAMMTSEWVGELAEAVGAATREGPSRESRDWVLKHRVMTNDSIYGWKRLVLSDQLR